VFGTYHPLLWIGVIAGLLLLLAVDLGIANRRAHKISPREASLWTAAWVSVAAVFGVAVFLLSGPSAGIQYFTGYLLELSLSVDNLFVFAVIFTSLGVPEIYRHRVLFWGIIGALLMRGIFIVAGSAFLDAFHWSIYLFGGLLLFASYRLIRESGHKHPGGTKLLAGMARVVPMSPHYHGGSFITTLSGRRVVTALFAALILVELTDLMFAIDSVPAILAVTRDPFLVFTSNAFAVLGLRSMYFVLSGAIDRFHYLKWGLALILGFVGAKLMTSELIHLPVWTSLLVMVLSVAGAVVLSVFRPRREPGTLAEHTSDGARPQRIQSSRPDEWLAILMVRRTPHLTRSGSVSDGASSAPRWET
jgi:tellurite resistance protein TerC